MTEQSSISARASCAALARWMLALLLASAASCTFGAPPCVPRLDADDGAAAPCRAGDRSAPGPAISATSGGSIAVGGSLTAPR
jgi:hypothetical protein